MLLLLGTLSSTGACIRRTSCGPAGGSSRPSSSQPSEPTTNMVVLIHLHPPNSRTSLTVFCTTLSCRIALSTTLISVYGNLKSGERLLAVSEIRFSSTTLGSGSRMFLMLPYSSTSTASTSKAHMKSYKRSQTSFGAIGACKVVRVKGCETNAFTILTAHITFISVPKELWVRLWATLGSSTDWPQRLRNTP